MAVSPDTIIDDGIRVNDPRVIDPNTGSLIAGGVSASFVTGPIAQFHTALGRWPGNNKQWWVAKAATDDPDTGVKIGDFQPAQLETFFSGNNRAPRGHYVLDAMRLDRSGVSGIAGLPVVDAGERPNSVTFFSGRAWFGCRSSVYYSQILDSNNGAKAGLCYQEADPTAEDISDLIDSDGGVVPIPEANHIEALTPMGNGVLVFAQNGVWFVSGGDAAFTARNIAVSKVSPIGTKCPNTIVEYAGMIFWWSEIGIQAIQQTSGQFSSIGGNFSNTNIAETTIQTFYNDIGSTAKHYAKACLDTRNNLVYWLYDSTDSGTFVYDSVLIYDITLQAFYPWRFSEVAGGPTINGLFLDVGYIDSGSETPVSASGATVTASADVVTSSYVNTSIRPSALYYLTNVPGRGLTVSAPVNNAFVDWEAFDGVGALYDSYLLTGYELLGDAMRAKSVVYLVAHFRYTEGVDGTASSCKLTTRYDWAGESNTNRWSSEIEAYRPRSVNLTDVVVSKNKVRGSGKAIQFRWGTNERGKTFDLLGWSVAYAGNTQP